jgi:hypothetical protein
VRITNLTATRLGAMMVVVLLGVLAAGPAYAAPPSNDVFVGAVTIGSIPYSVTQDVTEATTDANDVDANAACGAPALDASVWYAITRADDTALVVDVTDSSYPAGVLVITGAPGSFDVVTCGPGAVAFEAVAGVSYYLLIIDDPSDGGGNGGTLRLTVEEAPPPPELTVTVNERATFHPRTGSATVSGTIACVGDVEFTFIDVQLEQAVGRGEVVGFGSLDVDCDGAVRPWSIEILPSFGRKFAGGKSATFTFAVSCGPVFCSEYSNEQQVQLSRR